MRYTCVYYDDKGMPGRTCDFDTDNPMMRPARLAGVMFTVRQPGSPLRAVVMITGLVPDVRVMAVFLRLPVRLLSSVGGLLTGCAGP